MEGDEAGHLIASSLNGAGEQINLIPMAGNAVNRGAFLNLENIWRKALQEGKKVIIKITPIYEGNSKRPTKFNIEYTIDGEVFFVTIINN